MKTINEPTHPTDYRLAKLMDGSLLMGTISVDDEHMRIINPLELVTIPRMTNEGLKEDTTLSKWIPFTDDIEFVIAKDKVVVITLASVDLAHYYEVVLEKIETSDAKIRPALSADDMTWKSRENFTLKHFQERINIYTEEEFDYEMHSIELKD